MPQTRSQRAAANNAAAEQQNPPADAHVPNARSSARIAANAQQNNAPADDVNAHVPSDEQLLNRAFLNEFIARAAGNPERWRRVLQKIVLDRNKIRRPNNRSHTDEELRNLLLVLYDVVSLSLLSIFPACHFNFFRCT